MHFFLQARRNSAVVLADDETIEEVSSKRGEGIECMWCGRGFDDGLGITIQSHLKQSNEEEPSPHKERCRVDEAFVCRSHLYDVLRTINEHNYEEGASLLGDHDQVFSSCGSEPIGDDAPRCISCGEEVEGTAHYRLDSRGVTIHRDCVSDFAAVVSGALENIERRHSDTLLPETI